MTEKKWKIVSVSVVVISLAMLVVPRIFPICQTMMQTAGGGLVPMRCHYTYQVEFLVALASLVVSGALFFVRGEEGRRLTGWFLSLLGGLTILLPQPWVIGICTNPDEHCHLTYWWTVAGGILLVASGVVIAWLASRSSQNQVAQ